MAVLSRKYSGETEIMDSAMGEDDIFAYQTSEKVYYASSIKVFINGLKQRKETDYIFTAIDHTVTFLIAPKKGQSIEVEYR